MRVNEGKTLLNLGSKIQKFRLRNNFIIVLAMNMLSVSSTFQRSYTYKFTNICVIMVLMLIQTTIHKLFT